jgi:hypothetical protein
MTDQRIIWLASFPKSGNTWMRAFLANYFIGGPKGLSINELRKFTLGDIRADFYDAAAGGTFEIESLQEYLALRPKALRLIMQAREGTHFVKTHHQSVVYEGSALIPPELTAAAIYIMRNPFDVAPSYARHSGGTLDETIDAMLDPARLSRTPRGLFEVIGRWDTHIEHWTGSPGLAMHVVRYEDLRDDPKGGFGKVFDFLKVRPDAKQFANALKLTRLEALKKQEQKSGFIERPKEMSAFFHSGKVGGWRKSMTDAQIAKLHNGFEPTLRKYYPEIAEETAIIAARA